MFGLKHRGIVIGLPVVITLLFSLAVPSTGLADQEEEFDMNDRFATEKGASGIGKTAVDGDFTLVYPSPTIASQGWGTSAIDNRQSAIDNWNSDVVNPKRYDR